MLQKPNISSGDLRHFAQRSLENVNIWNMPETSCKLNYTAPTGLNSYINFISLKCRKSGFGLLKAWLWINTHCSSLNFVSTNTQVRDSLTMALSNQRTTSVKAVQLVSGSLYQVTQVANEVSLEAQVNNNLNSI